MSKWQAVYNPCTMGVAISFALSIIFAYDVLMFTKEAKGYMPKIWIYSIHPQTNHVQKEKVEIP